MKHLIWNFPMVPIAVMMNKNKYRVKSNEKPADRPGYPIRVNSLAVKKTFLFTILMFLIGAAPGCSKNSGAGNRISLNGGWKIKCRDSIQFAETRYNDSGWDTIEIPGNFIRYSLAGTKSYKGILWLRKSVYISKDHAGDMGLFFGGIANADQTYFNGNRIGSMGKFPPDEFSMWNHPRFYFIPSRLIRYDQINTIAVRISYNIYGGIRGDSAITNYDAWVKVKNDSQFSSITHAYLILSMAFLFFIIFLLFYIYRPQQEYLYYCLQIIAGFFIIFDLCTYWDLFPSFFSRLQVVGISWVALDVIHIIFLHRMYSLNRKKIEFLLWIFFALWCVIVFIFSRYNPLLFGKLLIVSCTLLGFYHIACHIYAVARRKQFSKLFSFFGLSVVLCAMHDGIVYFSVFSGISINIYGYTFNRMIFHYGAFVLFLGTALVLVARFLMLMDEIDDLNSNMENYIIENALLDKYPSGEKAPCRIISRESEIKIRKIIDYINNNYDSSISREGLAAAIDMHPDNLSKLFNAYKKMRIGDYINELRIKDAAGKLVSTDDSVIDIAFSVGFESLRTFNRAFSKYMNTSPERYRNQ